MGLLEKCTPDNLAWKNRLAFGYHYKAENGTVKTVFDYRIPFAKDVEQDFCARYDIAPSERMAFYKSLIRCVRHEIDVSSYLRDKNVPSILTFSRVEQAQDENKVTHVLLETEQVWPIVGKLFGESLSAMSVLDVFLRLCIILRDIGKEDVSVIHRGVDMNEVYINADNKILLGGFYYAKAPASVAVDFPPYLPCRPSNLTEAYLRGEKGSQAEDIHTLAITAWNVFSGLPHDAQLSLDRLVKPEFAEDELAQVLLQGIYVAEENCTAFRRNFTNCRKVLNKTDYHKVMVPTRHQPLKKFKVEYI